MGLRPTFGTQAFYFELGLTFWAKAHFLGQGSLFGLRLTFWALAFFFEIGLTIWAWAYYRTPAQFLGSGLIFELWPNVENLNVDWD